ncbi:MAG: ATP-dependent nuclease [Candidatus Cryptobacteroides sp.]
MYISKIKLHNFRRFRDIEMCFNSGRNILVGDNESGKSTILQAIDLCAKGSRHRIEDIGIERLLNVDVVNEFMSGTKRIEDLPRLFIELYLEDVNEEDLEGNQNSDNVITNGIRLLIEPDESLSKQTHQVLQADNASFPFEFYSLSFTTFCGVTYNGYTKKVKTILLDNSTIGNEYALNEYISTIYGATLSQVEQLSTKHNYGSLKANFKDETLRTFDNKLPEGYSFSVKNSGRNCLENDLTIEMGGVPISEKGTGMQCVVKTQLALNREDDIPIILVEEPENHLSHVNMRKMIEDIERSNQAQLFISTHSDLISTRLDLRNCIIMNSTNAESVISLDSIDEYTAKFFMKAPDNNMLQFVLAKKVILVEGDAEFILMDTFCNKVLNHSLAELGIDVIAVDGKCFKRYLEIAKRIGLKVGVVTDNDKNYDENIVDSYADYVHNEYPNVKIFADIDNDRFTFEVAVYQDNEKECEELFGTNRRSISVKDYMLSNKAEVAFKLLENKSDSLIVPKYIREALEWINA